MTTRNAIGALGGAWFGSGLWSTVVSGHYVDRALLEVSGFMFLLLGGLMLGWAVTR